MLQSRIILSDSSILGTLDNWDSYTAAGTGETVTNAINGLGQRAGLYCLKTSIAYGSAGTPQQGRTSEFVTINPAASGTAGVYAKLASGTGPKLKVQVLCYNSGQSLLDTLTVQALAVPTSSYAAYGATINASGGAAPAWPAGTAYAKIRIFQQATSTAQDGAIYFDDAYVTNGGANLLTNPGLGDGSATANTFTLNSPPAAIRGYRPRVNVAQLTTSGNVLYADQLGAASSIVVLPWTVNYPLSKDDLDGGFNHVTRAQDAGTQSLHNIYYNVSVGALNDIFLYRGSDKSTVRIMNPTLDFQPLPKQDNMFTGNLIMRIQYAS